MDWTVLGILQTKDKKAIKEAYRARLSSVNPEDKPEEFKILRAAYEEALRLAEETGEALVRDESPVGLWMEKIRALYQDYPARIRPENWKNLLMDEVCLALDKRPAAEEALLKFLLENFCIPQSVWKVFDEVFFWSERREELYEHYDRDFVDYAILDGIRYPATLPYEMYEPGENAADCDQYRQLYYQAQHMPLTELGPVLEQMSALSESHPYGQALYFRYAIDIEESEQGREGLRKLAEDYPDDIMLVLSWTGQCAADQNWTECERLARHILELEPEQRAARHMLVECLRMTERQDEAKKVIFELMHDAGGDQKKLYELDQLVKELNRTLIGRWEERLSQNPKDDKTALELAWCYLQNERYEEALAVCSRLNPDYEDPYEYRHLYAKTCYACRDYQGALEHLQELERILNATEPDGTEKTAGRLRRLPVFLQMEGSCLYALNRQEEVHEKYWRAVELAPEDPEILTRMAQILQSEKDHKQAVEMLEKLIEVLPDAYHGYYLLAESLYELHRDREAFDAVNRALEIDRTDLGVYVLKMRILLRNGVWDGVRNVLDFLRQNGVTDDISVLWCEAQLVEFEQENREKALEMYQDIAKRLEEGDDLSWQPEVYFRIAVLLAECKDAESGELREVLEKGLRYDPEDADCMDYKAWLLGKEGKTEEAIALYHKLEAMPGHALNVERELAMLYYRNLRRNADKALHYFQILLENDEDSELHFFAGNCQRFLNNWAGAEYHFRREQELAPQDVDAYWGLGYAYEAMGRYEEALENAGKAMELRKTWGGDQSRYWLRKVQILRRMGRPKEAVETVDEAVEKYGYEIDERTKFEIYCQFGMWEEARQYLDEWEKSQKNRKALNGAQIKLDMLMGNYEAVRAALANGGEKLDKEEYRDLQLSMDELDDDIAGQFRDWEIRRGKEGYDDYELSNLAQVCWWNGDYDEARKYAQSALEKEEEQLQMHIKNKLLYQSRHCLMLALLGREEEARAELEKIRQMPLCEYCDYGSCKDADIIEANIEEVCGHYQRAMELYRAGLERWPDDIDFAAGIRRLERRGVLV